MKNRVSISNYKELVRDLRGEDNYPMNAVVRVDANNFSVYMESGLYSLDDNTIELGRACDILDWIGIDPDVSVSENLKNITIDTAKWLTGEIESLIIQNN